MDDSVLFQDMLHTSADSFLWAAEQTPPEHRYLIPPHRPDDWSAARLLFHMVTYEEELVYPEMQRWRGIPPVAKTTFDAESEWAKQPAWDSLIDRFQNIRIKQIGLIAHLTPDAWERYQDTLYWDNVSLRWIVTKTLQHTAEHTSDLLKRVIFWIHAPRKTL